MTDDGWFGDDGEEAGRLVPLYVLVNGRTTPRNTRLDLATQVIAASADIFALEPEFTRILDRCGDWISIAEIAAYLDQPLTVTKILVDTLLERRYLAVGQPAQRTVGDRQLLETLLVGLREKL
jgi:hypothetical protein